MAKYSTCPKCGRNVCGTQIEKGTSNLVSNAGALSQQWFKSAGGGFDGAFAGACGAVVGGAIGAFQDAFEDDWEFRCPNCGKKWTK